MFDWWHFLGVAETLAGGDEAERRTAVSRAYYAAFGSALAWQKGWRAFHVSEDGNSHSELWNAFGDGGADDELHVAMLGHRLRRRRNMADYHPWVDSLSDLVTDSLEDAHAVRELLDRLAA